MKIPKWIKQLFWHKCPICRKKTDHFILIKNKKHYIHLKCAVILLKKLEEIENEIK